MQHDTPLIPGSGFALQQALPALPVPTPIVWTTPMPLYPHWQEIALRLVLTLLAGAIIGFNRGARGHAAGLRTTMLVGLAASVAMIQANLLLATGGKLADGFGVMDLMRLPLGILTGVGFIGGGAILKRGDLVTGVTTAATLWVMTVIGLCLGGGQLGLGCAATVLSVGTLWALKWVDVRIPREHRAVLAVRAPNSIDVAGALDVLVAPLSYRAYFRSQVRQADESLTLWFDVRWFKAEVAGPPLDLLAAVSNSYTVMSFEMTSDTLH
jgi:putative Mg2+ transporter-C (MgtC) family protein